MTVLFVLTAKNVINCEKILGIFPFPSKSHSIMIETIMTELVSQGHAVTVITNYPKLDRMENYTQVLIEPAFDYWKAVNTKNVFDLQDVPFHKMMNMLHTIGLATTEYALSHERVQEFLRISNETYDLIVVEQYYQEAFLVLAHKYQAPIVSIGTYGFANTINLVMGGINPWAHVPHEFLTFDDRMNFSERFQNVMACLYEYWIRKNYYIPKMNDLADKYFPDFPREEIYSFYKMYRKKLPFKNYLLGPLPSVRDVEQQISLILLNSNIAITTPRPVVPGIIQIGGAHIKSPKPLPRDIREFLDEAIYGAVFFSLGTNLRSADLPKDKLDSILATFSKMKQKVLWKFEDKIPNLPSNVKVKKWLPQSDILAHPHVRAFITHGGIFSLQEGIFRGVPMLGIPIYSDQMLNMKRAETAGYAITLHLSNLTETTFGWGLNEILHNPSHADKISKTSKIFRDRPIRALEEAIYWIEYVIRYKGAPHLRSSALDLSWFSYFLLDIVLVILIAVLMVIGFIMAIVKFSLYLHKRKKRKIDRKIL